MKKIFLILIIISVFVPAQDKYFIYFKDKGIEAGDKIAKTSNEYSEALSFLSEKSIERRIKNLGENNIISYEDLPLNEKYINQIENLGIKIIHKLKWFNSVSAILTEEQKNTISQLPFVASVEKVKKFIKKYEAEEIETVPKNQNENNITNFDYGFSFTQLQLSDIPVLHAKGIKGEGVLIGVLDSGFKWRTLEAFQHINIVAEKDFIFNDNNTENEPGDHPNQHNHGTTVLSVMGGFKQGSLIGASYGASFLLAKTEDIRSEKNIEEDNYAAALEWMENFGVAITTSSLGYSEFDAGENSYTYADMNGKTTIVTKAAELAFSRGVLTITSAGNEGNSPWRFITAPADGFNTIAVGAVNFNNNLASFSGRGPSSDGRIKPDVTAMGVSVLGASATGTNDYTTYNGTSLSAPIVSGTAALLLSVHKNLTNVQMRNILLLTAGNNLAPNNEIGYGLVSAKKAISFPNLSLINNKEFIIKSFIDDNGVKTNNVKFFISSDGHSYEEYLMNVSSDNFFTFTSELPPFTVGEKINFYFSYEDSLGNNKRHPENNNNFYILNYGKNEIIEKNPYIPNEYTLEQNYPNPFNNRTLIKFTTPEPAEAEIIIFNTIGEKIATVYKGTAKRGQNFAEWNGFNDNGIKTASGVYYYFLKISGKVLARKMIYLK